MSPVINYTYSYEPERVVTVVVAGIGVGIASIAAIGFVAYSLMTKGVVPKPPIQNNNRQQGIDENTRIEILTSDLKEIQDLLIQHRKEFRILGFSNQQSSPSLPNDE